MNLIDIDPVLDLQSVVNKYCELSPDPYARLHYLNAISQVEDPWQTVPVAWAWLEKRVRTDSTELTSIGDCQHGQWWEDWDFLTY